MLEQGEIHHAGGLGHADAAHEVADRFGSVAPAAHAAQGRHAGIVPAADEPLLDQLAQFALAGDGVIDVQAGEFDLARMVDAQFPAIPVVQRAMVLETEIAQRMRDALDRIGLAVREVVGGVDHPFGSGAVVMGVQDAIHHRVAQVDVRRGHVDLGAKRARAIGEFAGSHPPEQIEVFLDGAVAIGAVFARLGQCAAEFAHLIAAQVANEGLAGLDQADGVVVEDFEIVRSVIKAFAPVPSQPADIVFNRLDILGFFLGRIGVVEAQMAAAAEFARYAEVEADGLGMADVQIAIGLGREARDDLAAVFARFDILGDGGSDEIARRRGAFGRAVRFVARHE
ncbi:MAG: hypothetical protein BWZ10_02078 [candidate division BRC1 bacterium ADurb.BinA364]|nr:MAG: hypothetical protein BWZ10_02078 [candidate division BRC1 bacterium ADurb.BinA364]